MGLFNNLIGNPLNEGAVNQILARSEKLVNTLDRNNNEIAWMANNGCWIKLTSLIDLSTTSPLISKLHTAAGSSLAKKWVLFGGTITEDKSLKYGLDSYSQGYENPLGSLGLRPMPGIISADVSTLGQLGSLRSATISIRANNLEQLDILDVLFFRLGYSCLLEWGHVRYLDSTKYPKIGYDSVAGAELVDTFAPAVSKEDILRGIAVNRGRSSGNYDGLLGLITNYSYQSTPDGGYTCTVKLTGLGSVIDSTKINNISAFPQSDILRALKATTTNTPQPKVQFDKGLGLLTQAAPAPAAPTAAPAAGGTQRPFRVDDVSNVPPSTEAFGKLDAYRQYLNGKAFPASGLEAFLVDLKFTATQNIQPGSTPPIIYPIPSTTMAGYYFNPGLGMWPNGISYTSPDVYESFQRGFTPGSLLFGTGSLVDFESLGQVLVVPMPAPPTTATVDPTVQQGGPLCYVKLGLLLAYLVNSSITYESTNSAQKRPLVYINFNPEANFCFTNPQQLSINPNVCLIPIAGSDADYMQLFEINKVATQITGSLFKPSETGFTSQNVPGYLTEDPCKGRIMDIFVNIDYLLGTVQRETNSNGELNAYLSSFLTGIMKDISTSLGNINEFNVTYDDDANCITITDNQIVGSNAAGGSTLTAIPVQGLRSVAKAFSISTQTNTKIGSKLAITATDPKTQTAAINTDGSAFSQLSSGLLDRIMPKKTTDAGEKAESPTQDNVGVVQVANTFNDFVYQFYSSTNQVRTLNELNRSAAANYYIGAMNLLKSKLAEDDTGARKSVTANGIMPITANITLPGISNIRLYEAFMLQDNVLPSQYKDARGVPSVAFVISNLSHTIGTEGWNTTMVGTMMNIPKNVKLAPNVVGQKVPKYYSGAGKASDVKDICGVNHKNGEVDDLLLEMRPDLVAKHKGSLSSDGGRIRLIPAAMRNLEQMLEAATTAGIRLKVNSAYRTKADQVRVWNDSCSNQIGSGKCIRKPNKQPASTPGYSNHGFGYAVDLADKDGTRINPSKTPKEWAWIQANMSKYSFQNLDASGESHHYNFIGSTPCSRNKPV